MQVYFERVQILMKFIIFQVICIVQRIWGTKWEIAETTSTYQKYFRFCNQALETQKAVSAIYFLKEMSAWLTLLMTDLWLAQ